MKRGIFLSLLLVLMLTVTGCGSKSKTMTCTRTGTITKGTTFDYKYVVKYSGDYVDEINITEKVESDNSTYLETLKDTVEAIYAPYDGIKYHEYDVKIDGDKLISHRNINYKKIDTDKLIEADSTNKALIKDGKVKLSDVKDIYKALEFKCDE